MIMVKYKFNDKRERDQIVLAFVNAGYMVSIEEKGQAHDMFKSDFLVCVQVDEKQIFEVKG